MLCVLKFFIEFINNSKLINCGTLGHGMSIVVDKWFNVVKTLPTNKTNFNKIEYNQDFKLSLVVKNGLSLMGSHNNAKVLFLFWLWQYPYF